MFIIFQLREVVFYNVDAISGDLRWARLKVIKEILNNKKENNSYIYRCFNMHYILLIELFMKYSINIKIGDEVRFKDFSKKLLSVDMKE